MIKSMTGYGHSELLEDEVKISVELKSVNHKYMDANVKMPRKFIRFESQIRNILKEYASRGKVDIFISYEDLSSGSAKLKYDTSLAKEYFNFYKQIGLDLGLEEDIRVSSIARSPEVLSLEDSEIDEEETWSLLEKTVRQAFEAFEEAREKEGDSLKNDILAKLEIMQAHVDYIESRLPEIIGEYRQKLELRVKELLESSQIDDARIAAEVVMFADKIAIDEELVRLKSHIKNVREVLEKGGETGRKLDFLAQEMNREANTILSKSTDLEITNRGIELKTCIEKIREQVQNIE